MAITPHTGVPNTYKCVCGFDPNNGSSLEWEFIDSLNAHFRRAQDQYRSGGMVDASDLKSAVERREGSNPSFGTNL